MNEDKRKVVNSTETKSEEGKGGVHAPHAGGDGAHHWYDPIVAAEHKVKDTLSGAAHVLAEVEHKVENAVAVDMDRTIHDMDGWQKRIKKFSLRHPNWWVVIELLIYIAVIGGFLAAQIAFQSKR